MPASVCQEESGKVVEKLRALKNERELGCLVDHKCKGKYIGDTNEIMTWMRCDAVQLEDPELRCRFPSCMARGWMHGGTWLSQQARGPM